ncbi:MAG: hypothetical protein RIT14_238 [Pseudomonadota bacterium]|jgi:hypothetical protein
MRRLHLVLLCCGLALAALLSSPTGGLAQTADPGVPQVEVGAYILRIANVSQKDGTFDVDMWLWFRWQDPSLAPHESFEISNGRIESRSEAVVSRDGDMNYTSVRVLATIFHDFDVRHYPLDSHILQINIEDENLDASGLVYVADPNTAIDPDLKVPGWTVAIEDAQVQDHSYPTNYGLQSSGQSSSTYSRLVFSVDLLRSDFGPLFKQFWISALSVLLGLLAFRVRATDLDARFGLGVGSIFAASANAFVIADSLPQSTTVTLAEQINFLSIGTIFLCVSLSVWSLRICYQGRDAASERLDRWALAVISVIYVAANLAIVSVNL